MAVLRALGFRALALLICQFLKVYFSVLACDLNSSWISSLSVKGFVEVSRLWAASGNNEERRNKQVSSSAHNLQG